jgi:hypothetical protein
MKALIGATASILEIMIEPNTEANDILKTWSSLQISRDYLLPYSVKPKYTREVRCCGHIGRKSM